MDIGAVEIVIAVYVVLIGGLLLPLPSGARTVLWMALMIVSALTLLGGGAQYAISLVR